jgi:F420H(2)-dependent quinone reductase
MCEAAERPVRLPPRWFIKTFWKCDRAWYRTTRGHRGLWTPWSKRGWGALRLSVVGRRSGRDRAVILGYLEDGPDLVAVVGSTTEGPVEDVFGGGGCADDESVEESA